jgi:hypothetical protein
LRDRVQVCLLEHYRWRRSWLTAICGYIPPAPTPISLRDAKTILSRQVFLELL